MTAQDSRAMFEARMKQSPAYKPELMKWTDGRYDFDIMESAYHGFILGMESAKPVVPEGWRLVPERPTQEMCDAAKHTVHAGLSVFKWADGYYAMLAAAPKPPECLMSEKLTTKPEAAPVQMPDPAASAYMSEPKDDGAVCTEMMINPVLCKTGWNKLYTEHQVLEIIKGLR